MAEELSRVLGLRGTYPKGGMLGDRLNDVKMAIKSLLTSYEDLKRQAKVPSAPKETVGSSARNFTVMQNLKADQRFNSTFLNVNSLETLYRDFFKPNSDQIEVKNRCFKDLYNMIEESVLKFYELHVECTATKQKNMKLEETFQQLDQVFSQGNANDLN